MLNLFVADSSTTNYANTIIQVATRKMKSRARGTWETQSVVYAILILVVWSLSWHSGTC